MRHLPHYRRSGCDDPTSCPFRRPKCGQLLPLIQDIELCSCFLCSENEMVGWKCGIPAIRWVHTKANRANTISLSLSLSLSLFTNLTLLLRFPCKAFVALLREKGKPLDPMVLGISNEFWCITWALWWLATTCYNHKSILEKDLFRSSTFTLPLPSLSLDKPPDPDIQTVQTGVVTCQILSGPL